MNELLKTRINERLAALRKSSRAASLEVSNNADLIRNILVDKSENPRIDTLVKIATALDTTVEWLTGRSDQVASPITGDVRPADVPSLTPRLLPNDVPVHGTAAGSHIAGAFQLGDNVIDWARRPPAMQGARDLYALYVEGSSMEPEHRPGDLRFVHPGRPPRLGDSVIVQVRNAEHDPIQAMIGHLLRRTGDKVVIGKLNPEATVELKRDHVVAVHKVLTMNELFGL